MIRSELQTTLGDYDVTLEYTYVEGTPEVLGTHPDNCQEGEPAVVEEIMVFVEDEEITGLVSDVFLAQAENLIRQHENSEN